MKTPAINRLLKKKAAPKKKRKPGVTKNLVKEAKKRKKKTAVKAVMVAGRHMNPIEEMPGGGTLITGRQEIALASLLAQRGALKLEILGMKRRGPSVSSILKKQFGWKGNKEKILALLEAEIVARKASMQAQDIIGDKQPRPGFYVAVKPGTSVSDLRDGPFASAQIASDHAWDNYPKRDVETKLLITEVKGRHDNPSKHGRPFVRAKRHMFDDYDFQIGGHFLPALINGDTSGLSANEEHQLEQLVAQVPPGGHWDVISEEGYFGEDEVTGLRANVYDVKYYAPRKHWSRGRRNKNPRDYWYGRGGFLQVLENGEWKYVFAHVGGKIATTNDVRKALPGVDLGFFQSKFANHQFRVEPRGGRRKNPDERYNPYVEAGFKNRREYLASLAEEYGVPLSVVHTLASVLGPNEDFDGLVTHLEDEADRFQE